MGKPEGFPEQPPEIILAALTDGELANLAAYRQWHLDGTPEGHPDHDRTRQRAEEAQAELRRRATVMAE